MATRTLQHSFIALHLTLGVVLLYFSVRTALGALTPTAGHADPHVAALGIGEAIGAALFLVPRMLRLGAILLLLTIAVAFLAHLAAGQIRGDLLVYGVGTWFVMVHGSGWARGESPRGVAA